MKYCKSLKSSLVYFQYIFQRFFVYFCLLLKRIMFTFTKPYLINIYVNMSKKNHGFSYLNIWTMVKKLLHIFWNTPLIGLILTNVYMLSSWHASFRVSCRIFVFFFWQAQICDSFTRVMRTTETTLKSF